MLKKAPVIETLTLKIKIPTCYHEDTIHYEASAPLDCQQPGNIEFWMCSNPDCGRMFSDEACTNEIHDVIDAIEHDTKTIFNDDYHWVECNADGCDYGDHIEAHQFGTDASQISYFTCECGYEIFGKFTTYANTTIEAARKDTMAEIESTNLSPESVAAYKKDVNRVSVTSGDALAKVNNMADGKAALESALNELASIRAAATAEYKANMAGEIDFCFTDSKNAIKNAAVHDIVKAAALNSLDEMTVNGKKSVDAAETYVLAYTEFVNTLVSQMDIAEKAKSCKTFELLDGEDSTMVQNSDDIVKIRVDAAFDDFAGVTVDGILVAPENYLTESGSTIVTFNNDFLNTLTVGDHLVEMYWLGGMSTSNLTIKAAPAPVIMPRTVEEPKADDAGIAPLTLDPVVEKKAEVKADAPAAEIPAAVAEAVKANEIPSTGDNSETALWVLAMVVAVTAGSGVVANRKKKSR